MGPQCTARWEPGIGARCADDGLAFTLASHDAEAEAMAKVFREVVSQRVHADGSTFGADGLRAVPASAGGRYGVRVEMEATVERAR